MNCKTLSPDRDPMGRAILDFQQTGKAGRLRVLSTMFDEDEMPVEHLFRDLSDMPVQEQKALSLANGRILDIGAGAGCHSLALQAMGKEVKAIDISPLSCEAMRLRGVRDVECVNVFDPSLPDGYDTILLMMNGAGMAGKVARTPVLLRRLKQLLSEGGQILMDSSDLKYIYEDEDGNFEIDPDEDYYGEVDFQMIYKEVKGDSFDWLYLDYPLLSTLAESCGLNCERIVEGNHYDYLARLTKK